MRWNPYRYPVACDAPAAYAGVEKYSDWNRAEERFTEGIEAQKMVKFNLKAQTI